MANQGTKHIVGVISDTHGLVRPQAVAALQGCELIIHAGDIGKPEVLDELREVAPIIAVRGNVDKGPWADSIRVTEVVQVGKHLFYVLHNLDELDLDPVAAEFRGVITGHSHRPSVGWRDGVMYLNPGSAGPRRFTLPIAVARIHVRGDTLEGELVELQM